MMRRALRAVDPRQVLKHRRVRDYLLMTLGIAITAWGLDAFLIPNKLAAGGVSGLATVLHYVLRDQGLTIPVGMMMLAMNSVLFAIAWRIKGWRYAARTLYGMVVLSVAIDVLAPFTPHLAPDDRLLAVLYGGAVTGLGMGLVFKARGNTGGTDIIAQLLTERVSLGVGQLLLILDALVQLTAAFAFGPDLALYGAVAVFIMGSTIDVVQEGLLVERAAYIISDHAERIGEVIMSELNRGATRLTGIGVYSGEAHDVLFTVVSRKEVDALKALVHAVDPRAFLVISNVHEAFGEGFREVSV